MSSQTQASTSATLSTYLNDHLAGSKAGLELAERLRADNEGTPLGDALGRLSIEIDEDRNTLDDLMARLGVEASSVKQAAGWVLEKLSRVRLDERVTRSATTSRLMELETLSLGIEGKRLLWNAMAEVAGRDPRLAGVDIGRLISRAESQRQAIEPFRLQAAAEGLAA